MRGAYRQKHRQDCISRHRTQLQGIKCIKLKLPEFAQFCCFDQLWSTLISFDLLWSSLIYSDHLWSTLISQVEKVEKLKSRAIAIWRTSAISRARFRFLRLALPLISCRVSCRLWSPESASKKLHHSQTKLKNLKRLHFLNSIRSSMVQYGHWYGPLRSNACNYSTCANSLYQVETKQAGCFLCYRNARLQRMSSTVSFHIGLLGLRHKYMQIHILWFADGFPAPMNSFLTKMRCWMQEKLPCHLQLCVKVLSSRM